MAKLTLLFLALFVSLVAGFAPRHHQPVVAPTIPSSSTELQAAPTMVIY
jgi:hypothetical protein